MQGVTIDEFDGSDGRAIERQGSPSASTTTCNLARHKPQGPAQGGSGAYTDSPKFVELIVTVEGIAPVEVEVSLEGLSVAALPIEMG